MVLRRNAIRLLAAVLICAGFASAGVSAAVPRLSLGAQLWLLSPLSGVSTLPGTSNIPLFGNASILILSTDDADGFSAAISQCFAPSYPMQYFVNASALPTSFSEPTRLYYPNMFTGLEYVVGSSSVIEAASWFDSGFSFTVVRSIATSQRVLTVIELHSYSVEAAPSPGTGKLLFYNLTTSFVGRHDRRESSHNSWAFQPSTGSSSPFTCDHGSVEVEPEARPRPDKSSLIRDHTSSTIAKARWLESEAAKEAAVGLPSPKNQLLQRRKGEITDLFSSDVHHVLYINNSWTLTDGLNVNAFLIALQGLLNRDTPRLYIIYPPTWAWTDTPAIFEFYNRTDGGNMTFVVLRHLDDVLDLYANSFDEYVRWDEGSRESLLAGFSLAGLSDGYLLADDWLLTALNARRSTPLRCAHDLRGVLNNFTTAQAAEWLYAKAWANVSKDYLVYIGGDEGDVMHPGVADWGVARRTFFADLSTSPRHYVDEYNISVKLAAGMDPNWLLMGWHPYGKDQEHDFTTLASEYKGTVEGLNTQPNFSFNNKVPLPDGYRFQPNVDPLPSTIESKVYMTLVQTDGLGLGAWTKPGRGDLKYNWEVTLPDLQLQPAVLRFFYSEKTPKDYFSAALGGPGYMYPKAVPPDYLPVQLQRAQDIMSSLGLGNLIIFDASDCLGPYTTTGDTNIPPAIVQAYCDSMPNTYGFLNGYTSSFTFATCTNSTGGRKAFMSFDYYVDAGRNFEDVVRDLELLLEINTARPYFIALHVREYNTELRMDQIIEQLNATEPIELVSADNLLYMAAQLPTFRTHYH